MSKKLQNAILLLITLVSISTNAQKKCGTMEILSNRINNDNTILLKMQNSEIKTQKWISEHSNVNSKNSLQIITIPVVVHVLWNNSTENISDSQIQSQIDILNDDFSEMNSDALPITHPFYPFSTDTEIQFCLASRDPNGIATNGITRTFTNTTAFDGINENEKHTETGGKDNWNPTKYLNIWVCNLSASQGTLGYAQFPSELSTIPETDGVVIRFEAMGNNGTAGSGTFTANNLGRTATHEVGHWLNLNHIWGDNQPNCGNDMVSDTKPCLEPNFGCKTFPWHPMNICGTDGNGEMYMNYMDYVDDNCMNMFTIGQAERMQSALNNERIGLLSSLGCNAPLAVNEFDSEDIVSIYPNPNNGIFSINFNSTKYSVINLVVSDITGKILKNTTARNSQIDLSELSDGVYLVKIITQENSFIKKIIIKN